MKISGFLKLLYIIDKLPKISYKELLSKLFIPNFYKLKTKKMNEELLNKIRQWKAFFVSSLNLQDCSAETKWLEIIRKADFSPEKLQKTVLKASVKIGIFTASEQLFLRGLPAYCLVKDVLTNYDFQHLKNGDIFWFEAPGQPLVAFRYNRKKIQFFEILIVEKDVSVTFPEDLLISIIDKDLVGCVSFVAELPAGFEVKD